MNAIHSHRQPVAPEADVARGIFPSRMDRDERTGGGFAVPAGSLLIGAASFFGVLSAALIAGPIPGLAFIEPGRFAMGIVYGCAALAFLLAPSVVPAWHRITSPIITWGERQDWSRREFRRLVRELSEITSTKETA